MKVIARSLAQSLASCRRALTLKMCSKTPFMPVTKPFCTDVSITPFSTRNFSSLLARILWNSFPMQLVRANGRKLLGEAGSSLLYYIINLRRACARGLQYLVCRLSVCLSVCVCVFPILAPRAIRRTNSSISDFSAIRAWNIKRDFSLKRFVPKLWRRLLTSSSSGVVSGILVPFFRWN